MVTLKPLRAGTETISMLYKRPWLKDNDLQNTQYRLTVKVNDNYVNGLCRKLNSNEEKNPQLVLMTIDLQGKTKAKACLKVGSLLVFKLAENPTTGY